MSKKVKGDETILEVEKEQTAWNKQIEAEEAEKEKLPIDKLIEIADKNKLFPEGLTSEQKFERFIRRINLSDILKDCLQSSMNEFCKKYNQKNPKENLQFKLVIRKEKPKATGKTNQIFAVRLVLEMRRFDSHVITQEKKVTFTHVRELKDEAAWRYSLYAAMFQEIMNLALTLTLVNDDTNRGATK